MGVVIRRFVWLECIGVLSGGVVRRYIDFLILLFPTPIVLVLFLQQHPYYFVHSLKCFSFFITVFSMLC